MPSSYTPNLRLTLPVQGELAGTWGDTVNTGITSLTDTAIAGYTTVSITSAAQALTIASGTTDQARSAMLALTTTTTAPFAVYAPPVSKSYTVYNSTIYSATIYVSTVAGNTTAAGTGVTVAAGATVIAYSNATNFRQAAAAQTNVTGSIIFPAGTTAQRDATAAAGYMRWNTTLSQAEVYNGSTWGGVGGGTNQLTQAGGVNVLTGTGQMLVGPITIPSGQSINVASGARLVIL